MQFSAFDKHPISHQINIDLSLCSFCLYVVLVTVSSIQRITKVFWRFVVIIDGINWVVQKILTFLTSQMSVTIFYGVNQKF